MSITLQKNCANGSKMSVLDIRNRRLIEPTVPIPSLTPMLNSELAYVSNLLRDV